MVFSSAYAAMMGALPGLVTPETAVISDALNHNCIINAIRAGAAEAAFRLSAISISPSSSDSSAKRPRPAQRAIVVTDGIFSMRGDHAPLDAIAALAEKYDTRFAENVLLVVDDSHGVGAFGATGRGTEEVTGGVADVLVGTLGKAFGVNGGYVAASAAVDRLSARDLALLCLFQPDRAGRGGGAAPPRSRWSTARRAARSSPICAR